MSEKDIKNRRMAQDTLIYLIAKIIEGIVGVLTISVMSYIYLPEEMGRYSTINIAITTIAMVAIQWLVQSVLRYINKYDVDNDQDKFFSTVFFSWLKVNIITLFIGIFLVLILKINLINKMINEYVNSSIGIIIMGILMFITYNTSQLVIAMLAGVRKSKTNFILSIINVTGKLMSIIILNKMFKTRIEWIFLSYIIFDFMISFIGIMRLNIIKHINIKYNDKEVLNTLKLYGMPLMGNMIATSVLNKSDIYIITGFLGDDKAGIYQTNYSIIASAFTLLCAGAMRGSYPTIVRTWSEGKKELTEKLICDALRVFLLISIPSVIGIFSLSDFIAKVLFESRYFEGHIIMGFVALGMMFLGLTEYVIKPWELNAKTKEIFKRSMISGILNIILNLIFIRIFGYKFASVSTLITFLIYFILARQGTKKYMKLSINNKSTLKILLSGIIMGILILLLKKFLSMSIINLCLLVIFGIFIYFISLFISGEINNEIAFILSRIKKNS